MREAAVFKVIDATGKVHGTQLTPNQASAMMEVLLSARPGTAIRSERIDSPISVLAPIAAPVPAQVVQPLEEVDVGYERETLHVAIIERAVANTCLDAINQAAERAAAFVFSCQAELDALAVAHQNDIAASGASLVESFKDGSAAPGPDRVIDRSALLDAEVRRDTAQAALDQLTGEQTAAITKYKAAETRVRLLAMVVQRAEVDAAVVALEYIKDIFWRLHANIDASRFAGMPLSIRATEALRMDQIPSLEAPGANWHRFGLDLMKNAKAQFGDAI